MAGGGSRWGLQQGSVLVLGSVNSFSWPPPKYPMGMYCLWRAPQGLHLLSQVEDYIFG